MYILKGLSLAFTLEIFTVRRKQGKATEGSSTSIIPLSIFKWILPSPLLILSKLFSVFIKIGIKMDAFLLK